MAGSVLIDKYGSDKQIQVKVVRFINDHDYSEQLLESYPQKVRKIVNFAYQTSSGILLNPHEMARLFKVNTEGCHSNDYINLFSGSYGIPVYVTTPSNRFLFVCRDVIQKGMAVFLNSNVSPTPAKPITGNAPTDPNLEELLKEGEAKFKKVVQYERNPKNRQKAIEIHGMTCKACGFNFFEMYGEHGAGYIEVHHLVPLHQYRESTPIDPSKDLTVLCSNCHQMIHRYKLHYLSVEGLKRIIDAQKSNPKKTSL